MGCNFGENTVSTKTCFAKLTVSTTEYIFFNFEVIKYLEIEYDRILEN